MLLTHFLMSIFVRLHWKFTLTKEVFINMLLTVIHISRIQMLTFEILLVINESSIWQFFVKGNSSCFHISRMLNFFLASLNWKFTGDSLNQAAHTEVISRMLFFCVSFESSNEIWNILLLTHFLMSIFVRLHWKFTFTICQRRNLSICCLL